MSPLAEKVLKCGLLFGVIALIQSMLLYAITVNILEKDLLGFRVMYIIAILYPVGLYIIGRIDERSSCLERCDPSWVENGKVD